MVTTEFRPLPQDFFLPSASRVAAELLGHLLVRREADGVTAGVIVEAEAYLHNDAACHAFRGLTERNQAMFGPPGRAYVYFIYGCHFCVNAVCNAEGIGEAVLIRALEPVAGLELIRQRRPATKRIEELANGPGKTCVALAIGRDLNHENLCAADGSLIIARNPDWGAYRRRNGPVERGPRIGISKESEALLRFYLGKSRFVSREPRGIRF